VPHSAVTPIAALVPPTCIRRHRWFGAKANGRLREIAAATANDRRWPNRARGGRARRWGTPGLDATPTAATRVECHAHWCGVLHEQDQARQRIYSLRASATTTTTARHTGDEAIHAGAPAALRYRSGSALGFALATTRSAASARARVTCARPSCAIGVSGITIDAMRSRIETIP